MEVHVKPASDPCSRNCIGNDIIAGISNQVCLESDAIPATDSLIDLESINSYCLESDNTIKIPTLCACGCNEVVWNGNTFRRGHNSPNKGKSTWAKGKHFSEEHKRKIGESNTGRRHTDESKKKMSESLKKTGGTPGSFRKGHVFTEESLKRMSLSRKGKKLSCEQMKKRSAAYKSSPKWQLQLKKLHQSNKGRKHSEQTRRKLSEASKGKAPPNKGKPMSEEQKKKIAYAQTGVRNHNWQGGISFEPYCHRFNNQLKEKVRDRDNHTCQLCGTNKSNVRLSVHHIHYDKENCYPDLIALCLVCNAKVNGDRRFYEDLFMNKLNERGLLFWLR